MVKKIKEEVEPNSKMGRKRDPEVASKILEAAINTIADVGFDSMTMDMVAANAQTAKTTVYRRWPSKVELVRDALIWMGQGSVDLENVPDTGLLRDDLLLLAKPHSAEHSERKIRVLSKLGSFYSDNQSIADEVMSGIFGPWTDMNKLLIKRAIKRGEISKDVDVEMLCKVIVSMTIYRSQTERKQVDKNFYARLLDNVIMPAIKK